MFKENVLKLSDILCYLNEHLQGTITISNITNRFVIFSLSDHKGYRTVLLPINELKTKEYYDIAKDLQNKFN